MAENQNHCIHEYLGTGDVICHHEVIKCHFSANGWFTFVSHVKRSAESLWRLLSI